MKLSLKPLLAATAVILGGCTAMPQGPNVMVLPGPGKTIETFRADDSLCRQFAGQAADPQSEQLSAGLKTAAVTTAAGAVIGAVANGGKGAAVGAGIGAATGALVGSGVGSQAAMTSQQRYDNAYQQCMYTRGHAIPVYSSAYMTQPQPAQTTQSTQVPPPPPNIKTAPDPKYIVK